MNQHCLIKKGRLVRHSKRCVDQGHNLTDNGAMVGFLREYMDEYRASEIRDTWEHLFRREIYVPG